MWNRARMNCSPVQLASGTMPARSGDEQQSTFYQQQPVATQHLQNSNQNQIQFQQQQMYYHDHHHHQLQMNYQEQQQVDYGQHQHQQQINYHQQQEEMYYQQVPQQMNYHTQQQIHYPPQERSYQHQQQQPIQLQPGQQQQLNCQFPQHQPMLLQIGHHQQYTQDDTRTLVIGGLQHWMDEAYVYYCFSPTFPVCSVSLIWNKLLGSSEGYCYVEFESQTAAERVLNSYNSLLMPHTQCQPFKLQWASSTNSKNSFRPSTSREYLPCEGDVGPGSVLEHGALQETPKEGPEYSLWEGDLALGFITEPGLLQENP